MNRLWCLGATYRVGCALALLAASPVRAQYPGGFEWNRGHDWVPGAAEGSRVNNPGPDALGSATWLYEVARGGPLGSGDAWYAAPTSLLTWDEHWWRSGQGAWSKGDETNPPIFANRLTHNLGPANINNVPVVRWRSPLDEALVDVSGSLRILWTGEGFVGAPTGVEVVVAMFDADSGAVVPLLAATVEKPSNGLSVGDIAVVPVDLRGISLRAGDSLMYSARGRDVAPSHWIDIHDENLTITLVPEPAAGVLLAAAAAAGRRRRDHRALSVEA